MNGKNLFSGFKFRALSLWPARLRTSSFLLPPSSLSQRSGAALLIALAFIVILSTVVLALFSSTRRDLQSASVYVSGQETLRLAQMAVNVVQGQIRDATIQPRVGWASQPGMVRAFDTSGNVTAYKLYSSNVMVKSSFGQADITTEVNAMANWNNGAVGKSYNALYADLNSPAVVKRPDPSDPTQSIQTPVFPIADPAAIGSVEGFSATDPATGTTITSTSTRLPMPVKWLYVLKDGQLAAPSGNSTTVTLSPVPSQSNPVVGRIAFWADDDTCKLNINTASEGSFWDVPRSTAAADVRLGISIPVKGEFHRMAGHPASTSLSPALGALIPAPDQLNSDIETNGLIGSTSFNSYVGSGGNDYYNRFLDYFALTPRIHGLLGDTSSRGGTRRTTAVGTTRGGAVAANSPLVRADAWTTDWPSLPDIEGPFSSLPGQPIDPDTDRLYATTDELLFTPGRTPNHASLTADQLSMRDFFLTAQSRAPEVTLFGTPRISLWPINERDDDRTAKDKLVAFCTNPDPATSRVYSFIRGIASNDDTSVSTSSTMSYLRYNSLLAGNNQPSDSPTSDSSLSTNKKLVDYLRELTAGTIPGASGSFNSKFGSSGSDRLIAQSFDLIRSGLGSDYVSLGNATYKYSSTFFNPRRQVPSSERNADYNAGPSGFVAPLQLSDNAEARGMGRNLLVAEVAIVFMASEVVNTYTTGVGSPAWTGTETSNGDSTTFVPPLPFAEASFPENTRPASQQTRKVRAFLLMQPYNPTPGIGSWAPAGRIEIVGGNNLSLTPASGTSQPLFANTMESRYGSFPNPRMGASFLRATFLNPQYFFTYPANLDANSPAADTDMFGQWAVNNTAARVKYARSAGGLPAPPAASSVDSDYPFISGEIDVSSGNTMSFSGGSITLNVRTWGAGRELIQTVTLNYPAATNLPVPQHMTEDTGHFKIGCRRGSPLSPTYGNNGGLADELQRGASLSLGKRLRANGDSERFQKFLINVGDVVLGLAPVASGPTQGDLRLLALQTTVPSTWFQSLPGYGQVTQQLPGNGSFPSAAMTGRFATSIRDEGAMRNASLRPDFKPSYGYNTDGTRRTYQDSAKVGSASAPTLVSGVTYSLPSTPTGGAQLVPPAGGDWSGGIGNIGDGAIGFTADFGGPGMQFGGYFGVVEGLLSEGRNSGIRRVDLTGNVEPNRLTPSAGIFGGMTTTDSSGNLRPWTTLLLNPNPVAGTSHPGFNSPPDHLFLDNFWMPTVDPYPISDRLSTAGKVNLNAQLLPFTHVNRTTALQGLLKPVMLSGIPNAMPAVYDTSPYRAYKFVGTAGGTTSTLRSVSGQTRTPLDLDETARSFSSRWVNSSGLLTGEFYKSQTEVCEVPLIPKGSSLSSWLANNRPTPDTLREQPYTSLLSRVTTKSNTFTVHYRVQAVRQGNRPGRNWAQWDETLDQVAGEYRGSTTIERYLDPNTPNIPDYATVNLSGNYDPIDKFYRWRIVSEKQFAP